MLYYAAGIRGHYHESSDCFEHPKKCLLESSHRKNIIALKIPESKIPNPKKSFDHPRYPWAFNEQFITGTVSGNLSKFRQWEPSPNPGFLS